MKKNFVTLFIILLSSLLVFETCRKPSGDISTYNKYDLGYLYQWSLSSTPSRFPESSLINDLTNGYNRAHISWYYIDQSLQTKTIYTPPGLTNDDFSNNYTRKVWKKEIYDNVDTNAIMSILNIAYYPNERGQYNYDNLGSSYSKGINSNGKLNNPESRWGGIQRMFNPDLREVAFIEFWLMDPFIYNNINGDLYIDMGDINEDILRDNKFSNEASFSCSISSFDTSAWGRVFKKGDSLNFFSCLGIQDIGLDGLTDADEKSFFSNYLKSIRKIVTSDSVFNTFENDASNDNYHYCFGTDYDAMKLGVLDRYKYYNGLDGNSDAIMTNNENSMIPDKEDINYNLKLDTINDYSEYHININKSSFVIGSNFIDDIRVAQLFLPNGKLARVNWYHFKIPAESYESKIGQINYGLYPKFIRVYLTNFTEDIILRFAEFDLSYN